MDFGSTMVMVDRSTVKVLDDAIEVIDEATYMGAVDDETGDTTKSQLVGLRDRLKTALGGY